MDVRSLVLLVPLVLAGCELYEYDEAPHVAEPVPRVAVMGHWSGDGHQSDGPSWQMEVDVVRAAPGRCATISYPDVGCSGYWTCTQAGNHSLHGVEHITVGRDRCVDIPFVAAISDEGLLEYHARGDDGIDAFAGLTRDVEGARE